MQPHPAVLVTNDEDPESYDESDEPELPDGFSFVDDDEIDPVTRFLRGIGSEDRSGLRVTIKRMPDTFDLRGKLRNPANTEINHGDIPFDPDNLVNNVRDTLGGGHYRFSIKNSSGQFVTRPINMTIADPPGSGSVVSAPLSTTPQGRQPKTGDAIDEMIALADKYNKLRAAFGTPNGDASGNTGSVDEQTAVARALMQNPAMMETVVSGLIDKYSGAKDKTPDEPWYKDIALQFVRSGETSQLLVHGVFGLLSGLTELVKKAAGTLAPTQSSSSSNGGELAAATAPPRTIAPPPQFIPQPGDAPVTDDDDTPEHLTILDFLIKDKLANNVPVTPDEEWIAEMYERWPAEVANAETILTMPTATIKFLLIGIDPDYREFLELPHSDRFIDSLKTLIKERTSNVS